MNPIAGEVSDERFHKRAVAVPTPVPNGPALLVVQPEAPAAPPGARVSWYPRRYCLYRGDHVAWTSDAVPARVAAYG